jgi:hypothetical protein
MFWIGWPGLHSSNRPPVIAAGCAGRMIAVQFFIFRGTENFVSASWACSPLFIFCVSPEVASWQCSVGIGKKLKRTICAGFWRTNEDGFSIAGGPFREVPLEDKRLGPFARVLQTGVETKEENEAFPMFFATDCKGLSDYVRDHMQPWLIQADGDPYHFEADWSTVDTGKMNKSEIAMHQVYPGQGGVSSQARTFIDFAMYMNAGNTVALKSSDFSKLPTRSGGGDYLVTDKETEECRVALDRVVTKKACQKN